MRSNLAFNFAPAVSGEKRLDVGFENGETVIRMSTYVEGLGWSTQKTLSLDEAALRGTIDRLLEGVQVIGQVLPTYWIGVGMRFVFAFLLVCLTWNPTRYNYVEWALAQWQNLGPLVAFSGVVLLMGWIFFVRTAAHSLGALGLVLSLGLAATVP